MEPTDDIEAARDALVSAIIRDALQFDVESIETMLQLMNSGFLLRRAQWLHEVTRDEVIPYLIAMMNEGFIEVRQVQRIDGKRCLVPATVTGMDIWQRAGWDGLDEGSLWFGLTEHGKALQERSEV